MKRVIAMLLCACLLMPNISTNAKEVWSEWSDEAIFPQGAQVELKTVYRNRNKFLTTNPNASLEGWINYSSTYVWSDYGNWSAWSRNAISNSDSRQVEKRNIQATYETQYNYSRWLSADRYTSGPTQNTWGGKWCGTYQERGWSTSRLSCVGSQYSNSVGTFYLYGSAPCWYYETTRQVVKIAAYDEYRYRDRSKIYTYYFYKWSDWSEWSESPELVNCSEEEPADTEQESKILYRYKLLQENTNKNMNNITEDEPKTETKNGVLVKNVSDAIPTKKSTKKYKAGKNISNKKIIYKIKTVKGKRGTVEVKKVINKKAKSIKIPKWVKVNGYKFTIIGIGKSAFSSCSKVKKIQLKTTTLKYVHKKAFKGLNKKKYKIVVPQKCLKKYLKLFSKR